MAPTRAGWRLLLIVACAGGLGLVAKEQVIRVRMPAERPGATANCLVQSPGAGEIAPQSVPSLACPIRETISCDGDGVEPLDIPGPYACAAGVIDLAAAVTVDVDAGQQFEPRIEWLRVDDAGLHLVATRQLPMPLGRGAIPVAPLEERVVRLHVAGYSPVTMAGEVLPTGEPWKPPLVPGGEVVVLVADVAVVPEAFQFSGPSARTVEVRSRIVSVQGLSEGDYAVTPRYVGGESGPPLSVSVKAHTSQAMPFPGQPLGAVRVLASAPACGGSLGVVVAGPSGLLRQPAVEDCDWMFGGLEPGVYRVTLSGPQGAFIWREILVAPQLVADVVLESVPVNVSGRVELNGKTVSGFVVELQDAERRFPTITAPAVGGFYSADVGQPGNFVANVRDRRRPIASQERQLTLVPGSNVLDWAIDGGELSLELLNWDRSSEVQVTLTHAGGAEPLVIAPTDEMPARLVGLALGRYHVSAKQEAVQRASGRVMIELTEEERDQTVLLDLGSSPLRLVLRDERGAPVDAGNIRGNKVADGVYELTEPVGSPLLIRPPGFVPVCRVVPAEGILDVVVQHGQPRELRILGHDGGSDSRMSMFTPGSDCPIALRVLDPAVFPEDAPGTLRMTFASFPNAGTVTVFWSDRPGAVTASIPTGSTPLVVRKPPR